MVCDEADNIAGARHIYSVYPVERNAAFPKADVAPLLDFTFQKGAIKENGVNGVQNEDLIAICIDRLQAFQKGPFSCRENAVALTKLEEALMWLEKRTNDRKARNVEGTTKI